MLAVSILAGLATAPAGAQSRSHGHGVRWGGTHGGVKLGRGISMRAEAIMLPRLVRALSFLPDAAAVSLSPISPSRHNPEKTIKPAPFGMTIRRRSEQAVPGLDQELLGARPATFSRSSLSWPCASRLTAVSMPQVKEQTAASRKGLEHLVRSLGVEQLGVGQPFVCRRKFRQLILAQRATRRLKGRDCRDH